MSLFDVVDEEIEELLPLPEIAEVAEDFLLGPDVAELAPVLETPEEPAADVFEFTELPDAGPGVFFLLLFRMSAIDLALIARAFNF